VYLNCNLLPILEPASKVNPNVNLLIGLLKPPTKQECINQGLKAAPSSQRGHTTSTGGGLFSGLEQHPFGGTSTPTSSAKAGKN